MTRQWQARFGDWEVRKSGLWHVDGYYVDTKRFLETTDRLNGVFYDWPLHMSEKNWVCLSDFLDALLYAMRRAYADSKIDWLMWNRTVTEAWSNRRSIESRPKLQDRPYSFAELFKEDK